MSSLPSTIDRALNNIGDGPRDVLLETLRAFEHLGLPDEERVSAIATAVASSALSYHEGHVHKFLDAVQIWALELVGEHSPPLPRIWSRPVEEVVAAAADILCSGLDTLLNAMGERHVQLQDRVIVELTLFSRPLGEHDVHTILLAVSAITDALGTAEFNVGDVILVPLRDPLPVGRGADLSVVPIRGIA